MPLVSSDAPYEPTFSAPTPSAPLHILLVEDDDDGRDYFAFVFASRGVEVTAVESAGAALSALDCWCPDAIVSDIGLPGKDGYELIRRVRGFGDARSFVPAVAVTAFTDDDVRDRAFEAGFQAYLSKPVASERLLGVVAELIERLDSLRRLVGEAEVRRAGSLVQLARMQRAVAEGHRLVAESRRLRCHARALRGLGPNA